MKSERVNNKAFLCLCLAVFVAFVSCSDKDDESYPALITELVMSSSDSQCMFTSFTTDDDRTFKIANSVKGPSANVRWRFLCGYVKDDETTARVYTFIRVPFLPNYAKVEKPRRDATGFASIWKSKGYINLHLLPLTKGGQQGWGFLCDSTLINDAGGNNYFVSLIHYQLNDVKAYTEDLFVSLDLDSISTTRSASDSIFFRINTFDGWRSWLFNAQ